MPRYLILCRVIFVVGMAVLMLLVDLFPHLGFLPLLPVAWMMGWGLIGAVKLNKWPAPWQSKGHHDLLMLWLLIFSFFVYFALRIAILLWRN